MMCVLLSRCGLLHAAQAEIENVVVDVGALGDRGEGRLLGFGDVVEVAGVVLDVLDVRVDGLRAFAEFLAGIDDRRNLHAADIAHAAGLGEHRRGRAGDEGDLGLLHVVAGDVRQRIGLVAADDRELGARKPLGDLVDGRLGLAADADHQRVVGREVGERLLHVGVVDVLDHLHLDLVAVLLLRGHRGRHSRIPSSPCPTSIPE